MNILKLSITLLLSFSLLMPAAYSQNQNRNEKTKIAPAQVQQSYEPISTGTRRRLSGIIFSGLGGAVLGLSTLSFHGRPQDHLQNIAIGFALGVMAGTLMTTYKAVQAPYEEYEREQGQSNGNYSLLEDEPSIDFKSKGSFKVEPAVNLSSNF